MRFGKVLLDQFAEGKSRNQLFLLNDRDPHYSGTLFFHNRMDQHPVHVAVNVDLVIIQGFQDFRRHEGFINDIGFYWREADLRGVIAPRNDRHCFVQDIGSPFQLIDIVKILLITEDIFRLMNVLDELLKKRLRGTQ